jgi:hypothetical protein
MAVEMALGGKSGVVSIDCRARFDVPNAAIAKLMQLRHNGYGAFALQVKRLPVHL